MKRIAIIGGGTFSPIRNHLALCAPAFGSTAKRLKEMFNWYGADAFGLEIALYLTKMANPFSLLVTNEDVSNLVDDLIKDPDVSAVIMNAALCDFDADIDDRGFHGRRLKTSDGDVQLTLKPSEKVLDRIRAARPDILLVAFKTTTSATAEEQFIAATDMMERSKCSLVLANDTVTRNNIIINPKGDSFGSGSKREVVLQNLVEMILKCSQV